MTQAPLRDPPLAGMRILTLELFGAGPYGTALLADLGAEVIKVEAPEVGDAARHVGPHLLGTADSQYFQSFNTNKKSVALDIKTAAGRAAFHRLVAGADAVVNNLRGDQPAKLGLDYASLRDVNPRIVCLHISAYGRDNERHDWPGYDFLMQAEAGLMSLTGDPDAPPARLGASMVDFMTGTMGMVGLLASLQRAQRTGRGGDVDTNLFEVALHQLSYSATWWLNAQDEPKRLPRAAHLSLAPVQTVPTQDGWLYLMCMTEKFWRAAMEAVGHAHLADDPRFADFAARRANREALTAALDAIFRTAPTRHWLGLLQGHVPVAPVNDVPDAFANPLVDALGMVRDVPHPHNPALRLLAPPLRIDGERPQARSAPALGADNEEFLGGAKRDHAAE